MTDMPDTLNAPAAADRLAALRLLVRGRPAVPAAVASREVNNHVHTFYSFSPYSPSEAATRARDAGLLAVGIMDHDSVAGVDEMREAGRIIGIATTAGFELRVNVTGTPLEGRKINNPDSVNILYMTVHGVPARSLPAVRRFLKPLQAVREARGRVMTDRLNGLLSRHGIGTLDWKRDVSEASRAAEGGSITERHILFAVARKLVEKTGRGVPLLSFLRETLGLQPSPRLETWLADESNSFLLFDLLGLLKSSFLSQVFVQPNERECIGAERVIRFAEEVGGIPCYAYLGDVTDSPTGDKKAETFEDGYLDELMEVAQRLGFRAVTYMPPRNTLAQLLRVRELCARHGFMEISGVDINSPRQSFHCPELTRPEFSHLIDTTWALIAHEKLSDADPRLGLFHPDNPLAGRSLSERIAAYAKVGSALDPSNSGPALPPPEWTR